MACQIGITTDLERRKAEWLIVYPNLRNWQILESNIISKDEAQKRENYYARIKGCNSGVGGREPDDPSLTWSVYYFEY